jgi:hypothetical protein
MTICSPILFMQKKQTLPDEHLAEADYQIRRAINLTPGNDEVKNLRAEVVKLLNLSSCHFPN